MPNRSVLAHALSTLDLEPWRESEGIVDSDPQRPIWWFSVTAVFFSHRRGQSATQPERVAKLCRSFEQLHCSAKCGGLGWEGRGAPPGLGFEG
jgi:hypothetical protein